MVVLVGRQETITTQILERYLTFGLAVKRRPWAKYQVCMLVLTEPKA